MKYKLNRKRTNAKNRLNENIEKLTAIFEKLEIEDVKYILGSKKQLLFKNFFAGVFRGVGIGIGITIITAIVVILLQKLLLLNIPIIGDYVSDIIDIINQKK